MEFKDLVLEHVKHLKKFEDSDFIEEQTKMYLIAPLLNLLGYNIFNPDDVVAEYVADIGKKKGEKVDYAIKINNEIEILIEAKAKNDNLENHDIQLKRYFNVTKAKIGILTNGIKYKFFTDLDDKNIMDNKPFLVIDFFDLTDEKINELKKFTKSSYNSEIILTSAETLKYSNGIKNFLNRQLENPEDELIKLIGKKIYDGRLTQDKLNELKNLFKNTFINFINDFARKKFESILENNNDIEQIEQNEKEENLNSIITTEQELEAFYIIRSILRKYIDINLISYKDTHSYFGILYNNKVTQWICRFYTTNTKLYIVFPNTDDYENESARRKKEIKFELQNLDDIYNYEETLVKIIEKFQ